MSDAATIDAEALLQLARALKPDIPEDEVRPKGRAARPCAIFSALVDPAYELVCAQERRALRPLLDLAEACQVSGTPEVENAACTCFLESLSNRLSWHPQRAELTSWVRQQLEPLSAAFWDAWEAS